MKPTAGARPAPAALATKKIFGGSAKQQFRVLTALSAPLGELHHVDLVDEAFDYSLASARVAGRDASALLDHHGDHSQSARKQLTNILASEVDPAGRRELIGQSGTRDAEGFRLQVEAFLQGLTEHSQA